MSLRDDLFIKQMAEENKKDVKEENKKAQTSAEIKAVKNEDSEKTQKTQKTTKMEDSEKIQGIQKKDSESVKNDLKDSVKPKKKKKKTEPFLRGGCGQVYIKATYNNTIVTVADLNGAVLVWGSAGKSGFKGPKKSTPYAAGIVVKSIVDKTKEFGIKEVKVVVKGVGMGREAAIRALDTNGLKIVSIRDETPIPHGGCRPRKKRRV